MRTRAAFEAAGYFLAFAAEKFLLASFSSKNATKISERIKGFCEICFDPDEF